MKFQLKSQESYLRTKVDLEIPVLRELGFQLIPTGENYFSTGETYVLDYKNGNDSIEIDISTLEELMDLSKRLLHPLVVSEGNIVIYNDYMD